jgi:DNA gyrase subunit A
MGLNDKASLDFLVYANAVIKSRAISDVSDNLKPVHRRILFTLWDMGLDHTHKTTKSANVVGSTMTLHPHGDASIYDAMIRLAQPWKMRYPLVEIQGNYGNVLGYDAAASRYTECRLSPIGDFMLADMNRKPVPFKPNYDNSKEEPVILPGMFPNILCNGNSGIAVGLSSALVPHNYNEVADAIKFALTNETGIGDFIKGPDFPTGAVILNGEELPQIYKTGNGTVKLQSKYRIENSGGKTHIVFSEIPYLVTIEDGIIEPIKKLVNEEGYDIFNDIINNTNEKSTEIRVVLNKGVDPKEALSVLWAKTNLQTSVKINQMVINNGKPEMFSLEGLIRKYIEHRNIVLINIAKEDYTSTNHKLQVAIGLEKCTSNIDLLVKIVREAETKDDARTRLVQSFDLTSEQVEAILDLKLSRLNRLDIKELEQTKKDLETKLADYKEIIESKDRRSKIILEQLELMRKNAGDPRRTTIGLTETANPKKKEVDIKTVKWYSINSDKIGLMGENDETAIKFLKTNSMENIILYNKAGDLMLASKAQGPYIGGMLIENKPYIMTITKLGYVKKTLVSEYNFSRISKALKIRDNDELILVQFVDDNDFILALTEDSVVKIATTEIEATTKLTMGVKITDFNKVLITDDSKFIMMMDKDNHGKITSVRDFNVNSRTSPGQKVAANTVFMIDATDRDNFILKPKSGKISSISKDKFSIKSKTAIGAQITTKSILDII